MTYVEIADKLKYECDFEIEEGAHVDLLHCLRCYFWISAHGLDGRHYF